MAHQCLRELNFTRAVLDTLQAVWNHELYGSHWFNVIVLEAQLRKFTSPCILPGPLQLIAMCSFGEAPEARFQSLGNVDF